LSIFKKLKREKEEKERERERGRISLFEGYN
jgi:hypothetical protein